MNGDKTFGLVTPFADRIKFPYTPLPPRKGHSKAMDKQ